MSQTMSLGKAVAPLRNVATLAALVKRVETRQWGLPGLVVFHGKTGLGKSYACAHAVINMDAIHISVDELWTKKKLMTAILRELGAPQAGSLADLMERCKESLAKAGRTLIVDEADCAVDKGMINIIRNIHDGTHVPIVLVGEEFLPQKLKKWERVSGRIFASAGAELADFRDAKLLADVYARDVELDDALIEKVRSVNNGSVRQMSVDLSYILEQSRQQGQRKMTLDEWGDAPFFHRDIPQPRKGMING